MAKNCRILIYASTVSRSMCKAWKIQALEGMAEMVVKRYQPKLLVESPYGSFATKIAGSDHLSLDTRPAERRSTHFPVNQTRSTQITGLIYLLHIPWIHTRRPKERISRERMEWCTIWAVRLTGIQLQSQLH